MKICTKKIIGSVLFAVVILGGEIYAQEAINIGFQETCTEKIITGETSLRELEQLPEFWMEYLKNYADYALDEEKIKEMSKILDKENYRYIYITAVIGTWCGDSKEQFPVLQKIIDRLQRENIHITYIGVDRDKLAGETNISDLGIEFVPTFVFYAIDRIEDEKTEFPRRFLRYLGRIVETPEGTMEGNILKILSGK